MARPPRQSVARAEIAAVAARALASGEARDFATAREQAERELGCNCRAGASADNLAIHRALIEYLQLFLPAEQAARIDHLRRQALRALELFAPFNARLCGPVWYGTALPGDPVSLHLTSDETEAVTRFLLAQGIDYYLDEAWFAFGAGQAPQPVPVFRLVLDKDEFELAVFPSRGACRQPISSLDRRAMRRVGAGELEAVLAAGTLFPDLRPAS